MNEFTLKFPTGQFTHTELAQLNGKTNQQVWIRYQEAIKSGVIISAGERPSAGRGKPSRLWEINPNPGTIPDPIVPTPKPVKEQKIKTPKVKAVVAFVPPAIAPTVPTMVIPPVIAIVPSPIVEPTLAPITPASPPPIVVINVVAKKEIAETPIPKTDLPFTLQNECPICGKPMNAIKDATGYRVWCAQPIDVCWATENPFGHGTSVKQALEVINQKYEFATKDKTDKVGIHVGPAINIG